MSFNHITSPRDKDRGLPIHRSSHSTKRHFTEEDNTFLPPALSSYSIALLNREAPSTDKNLDVIGVYELDFPQGKRRSSNLKNRLSVHFRKEEEERSFDRSDFNDKRLEKEPVEIEKSIDEDNVMADDHAPSTAVTTTSSLPASKASTTPGSVHTVKRMRGSRRFGKILGPPKRTSRISDTHEKMEDDEEHNTSSSAFMRALIEKRSPTKPDEIEGIFGKDRETEFQTRVMEEMRLQKEGKTKNDHEIKHDMKRFSHDWTSSIQQPQSQVSNNDKSPNENNYELRDNRSNDMQRSTKQDAETSARHSSLDMKPSMNQGRSPFHPDIKTAFQQDLKSLQKDLNTFQKSLEASHTSDPGRTFGMPIPSRNKETPVRLKFENENHRVPLSNLPVNSEAFFRKPKAAKLEDRFNLGSFNPRDENDVKNVSMVNVEVPKNPPGNTPASMESVIAHSHSDSASAHQKSKIEPAQPNPIPSNAPHANMATSIESAPKDELRRKTITINGRQYEKLELLGRGGTSKVYKVKALANSRLYAIKKVTFDQFEDSCFQGFKGEIDLLQRLRKSERVVKLVDHAIGEGSIYLVMECGDLDLAHVLQTKLSSLKLDLGFVKYHAIEVFKCVETVHMAEIVHSDLKPANFLFVRGILKIIDFGIANAVPEHTANIYRESQIGTPNYMAPEALVELLSLPGKYTWKVGKPSDVWSCGCIVYQMIYGKPPYGGYSGNQRIMAIMNPQVKITFPNKGIGGVEVPQSAIELMLNCLARDPLERWTVEQCLKCDFLKPKIVSEAFIRDLVHLAVNYGYNKRNSSEGPMSADVYDALVESVLKQIENLNYA